MKTVSKMRLIALTCVFAISFIAGCGSNASKSDAPTKQAESSPTKQAASTESAPAKTDPPKEKAKLKIMFQKGKDPDIFYNWMQETIQKFKETNPNVDFEVINSSGEGYQTMLTTEMAANNVPDIFQGWTMERMKPFVDAGRLLDLAPEINADPQWKDFLQPGPLQATTFNGGIYGIPATIDTEVMFYNKDVFAKYGLQPPQTFDDYLHIVDVLKPNKIVPQTLANKDNWLGSIPYMMILDRVGGIEAIRNVVVDKTQPWTSEPVIQAANKLQEMIKRGAFEKDVNSVTGSEMYAKFSEGKASMYAGGSWDIPGLYSAMKEKVGFFNFPDIPGGKGSKDDFIIIPNNSLSISKDTKYKDEAVAFLKFAFSQERQQSFAKLGFLSTTKVQVDPKDVNPLSLSVQEALAKSKDTFYPFDVNLGPAMGKEFNNTTQTLYLGDDPQKAFAALQKKQDNQPK